MISFQLPNTGFILGVSYECFTRPDPSDDPQDSLCPHVLINRTRDDLIRDNDPVVGYIIEEMNRQTVLVEAAALLMKQPGD